MNPTIKPSLTEILDSVRGPTPAYHAQRKMAELAAKLVNLDTIRETLQKQASDGYPMSPHDLAGKVRWMVYDRIMEDRFGPEIRPYLVASLDLVNWLDVAQIVRSLAYPEEPTAERITSLSSTAKPVPTFIADPWKDPGDA